MLGLGLLSGARHIESRDSILAKPWRTDARPAAGVAVFMVADIALVPTSNAWRRWLAALILSVIAGIPVAIINSYFTTSRTWLFVLPAILLAVGAWLRLWSGIAQRKTEAADSHPPVKRLQWLSSAERVSTERSCDGCLFFRDGYREKGTQCASGRHRRERTAQARADGTAQRTAQCASGRHTACACYVCSSRLAPIQVCCFSALA